MKFFNLHTHQSDHEPGIKALVNQYPSEFIPGIPMYSIGIHPWHIKEATVEEEMDFIKSKITDTSCFAIGECGLDKRVEVPFDLQVRVFERHITLAEANNKPVIIHCVSAFQELIELKRKHRVSVPMIIHGFSKSSELAGQLVSEGFYLSFGKNLLRNPQLKDTFLSVPPDVFFLETDTLEESITEVYNRAAVYKEITIEILQNQIEQNFNQIFINR